MNGWIVFQLLVDVALFAIIVVYLIRSGHEHQTEMEDIARGEGNRVPEVDLDEIEKLLDELARLVMRAEKVAVRIEKGVENATSLKESQPNKAEAERIPPEKNSVRPKTSSKNTLDDEQYSKAVRLIKKGMSNEEIERKAGLPAHEIALIRRMGS